MHWSLGDTLLPAEGRPLLGHVQVLPGLGSNGSHVLKLTQKTPEEAASVSKVLGETQQEDGLGLCLPNQVH